MQHRHPIYFFLLLILATTALSDCNIMSDGKPITILASPDYGSYVTSLANDPGDTTLAAIIALTNASKEQTGGSFFDIFRDVAAHQYPQYPLAKLFEKPGDNTFHPGEANTDVINALSTQSAIAIARTTEVLSKRLQQIASDAKATYDPTHESITITFTGPAKFERVRDNVLATGDLEFYEVYSNQEMFPLLAKLNEQLSPKDNQASPESQPDDTTDAPTGDTGSLGSYDTLHSVKPAVSTLFAILLPNSSASYSELNEGPQIGFAKATDTARINKYLHSPAAAAILPRATFMYGYSDTKGSLLSLYAINNANTDNRLPGSYVTKATAGKGFDSKPDVTMEMDVPGAIAWRRFTRKNIGRYIAVTLDNTVYSCPRVESEITGGNTEISGKFTTTQAADLASIFTTGRLPMPVHIVERKGN